MKNNGSYWLTIKSYISILSMLVLTLGIYSQNSFAQTNSNDGQILKVKYRNQHAEWVFDEIPVKFKRGKVIFQGDMELGSVFDFKNKLGIFQDEYMILSLAGKSGGGSEIGGYWAQSIVPYTFSQTLSTAQKTTILNQLSYAENTFGIQFVPRTNQGSYVQFTFDPDLWACGQSAVGKTGSKQYITLRCMDSRTIIHEIGHAIGYIHEHSRSDRDSYININYSNLDDCSNQFSLISNSTTDTPYDINSIMHYGSYSTPTCVFDQTLPMLTGKNGNIIPWAYAYSNLDIIRLKMDYGAYKSHSLNFDTFYCYSQGVFSWDSSVEDTYYRLEKSTFPTGPWSTFKTTSSNSYTQLGRSSGNYYVRVIGVNGLGEDSANSNTVYVKYYSTCY